jgi:tRNA(adenine34) deaminase
MLLSPELEGLDLEMFMREALAEASAAGEAGELPIGAVVVLDGRVIGRGRARHQEYKSQIRHAELNALLYAEECLWSDCRRAILFTTVEPCPMCLGATVMADIPHIIFAKHDANVHSRLSVETNPYIRRHIQSYHGGVLEEQSTQILAQYKPQELKTLERGSRQPCNHCAAPSYVRAEGDLP